ncbi:TonB-dependent receptor [Paraflavisolibacter sp. H34]|uniref:SusC/RagA family TonB-linked outer membrane protein n=1 Tax=Huijunlia imazamoxiresistens TaxID=3127457 RepID=UPI0030168C05
MKKIELLTRSLLVLLALLYIGHPAAFGQGPIVIKGTVTEGPSGGGLSGVTVVEVNENDRQLAGVNTDETGSYTLRVSDPKHKLRFSYIGFETKTEAIGGRTVVNITLARASKNDLDDVTVIATRKDVSLGFGNTSKRDLIGSVASIKGETLSEQPATSIDQMMQGRAAGVQVVTNSGDPGSGVDIRIRGAGSISGGNDPLYIVDGIPIISTPFDPSNDKGAVARINPIADINPSDIERIDILKDANASAIYGARAANGVVIITTKRGKKNVTNITFNSQLSLQAAPAAIPVLDGPAYKVMRLEAEQHIGNINPSNATLQPLVDDPAYPYYIYYQSNTNWMKELRQTGLAQVYNLSVSGGGEAMRYNFSTSYTNRKGAMVNTGNTRMTGRFNLDYTVSKKLRFSANISFARSKVNNYADYGQGSVYYTALVRSPAMPIYDVDVNGNPLPNYFSLGGVHTGMDNPIAYANSITNDAYSTNLKPNIRAELDILPGLKYTSNASLDFVGENGLLFLPPDATGLIWNDQNFNRVDTRDFERQQMILDNLLTYTRGFSKMKTSFILGNTFNTFNSNQLVASAYATGSSQLQNLGSAAGYRSLTSSKATETIVSGFAKADLVIDDKYGFNATIRRDGSSKFGGANKYGNFPSVGAYWRVSSENFMKSLPAVSDLKFRASWGRLGNSGIPNYAYISQFSLGANYMGYNGVRQTNPSLNDLRWETNESTNLGMDLSLFRSRLNVTLDWYNKDTKDLLYTQPLPASSGLGSILTNLGTIRNQGVELDVNIDVLKKKKNGKGVNWNLAFNLARNDNEVRYLPGGSLAINAGYANFTSQVKAGDPLGTYYGLVYKGVYAYDADAVVRDAKGATVYELDGQTPRIMRIGSETGELFKGGDAIYEDFNHDGIINDQDKVLIGNANANFFGGFNNSFDYKNFGLRFFIQFQEGNNVINGLRYYLEGMTGTENQAITTLKRWRKQGDVTNMPRALRTDTRNTQASTRWIEDGSYARLKFVTLNYRFPQALVKKVRMKGIDAFVTANNLLTWTNYTGADPEVSIGWNPALIGIDRGLTPQTRGYTLGINARF